MGRAPARAMGIRGRFKEGEYHAGTRGPHDAPETLQ